MSITLLYHELTSGETMAFSMDESILSILACPETHSPLAVAMFHESSVLVCTDPVVHRCYPIVDEIPELLIESIIHLTKEEHGKLLDEIRKVI